MNRSCFFYALVFFFAVLIYLMRELTCLIPYRTLLVHRYAGVIGCSSAIFCLNLFIGIKELRVRIGLKRTGQKLARVDRQLGLNAARN